MRGDEGVHKGLEVRPPPLRQRVGDLPLVVDAFAGELCADWGQALVQALLEARDLVVVGVEVVSRPIMRTDG